MKDWFMNLLYYLKRPFIRLSRFRYRCGYGVHSPFAFSLITDVIYEKMPYYAYDLLKVEQKKRITTQRWEKGIPRINRLLFRLVNKVRTRAHMPALTEGGSGPCAVNGNCLLYTSPSPRD